MTSRRVSCSAIAQPRSRDSGHKGTTGMRRVASATAFGVLVSLALTSCLSGVPIGNESWLDYYGDHPEVVRACVDDVPSSIDDADHYPGAVEFNSVEVSEIRTDQTSIFIITGVVDLYNFLTPGAS